MEMHAAILFNELHVISETKKGKELCEEFLCQCFSEVPIVEFHTSPNTKLIIAFGCFDWLSLNSVTKVKTS